MRKNKKLRRNFFSIDEGNAREIALMFGEVYDLLRISQNKVKIAVKGDNEIFYLLYPTGEVRRVEEGGEAISNNPVPPFKKRRIKKYLIENHFVFRRKIET